MKNNNIKGMTNEEIIQNAIAELQQASEKIREFKELLNDPIGTADYVTEDDMLIYDIDNSIERLLNLIETQKTHYIIVNEWAEDLEQSVTILEIAHSLEEAKEKIIPHIQLEKAYAEEKGYEIFEENEMLFDAGEKGHYAEHHTLLSIKPFNEKNRRII